MDLHRIRRLAGVLISSELRSGRSLSDARSLVGRPLILGVIDVGIFLGVFALAFLGLRALGPDLPPALGTLGVELLVLIPILAVSAVLVAGVMFEFSTGSRFATSDTVNWLPLTPREYVAASALAVSLAYSPAVAFILGAAFALSLVLGLVPAFLLATALGIVALFEGGVLIEMLRAATQRAASALSGRKGKVTLALRAVLFLVVILLFELAFNPLLLTGVLGVVSGLSTVSTFIPFFWSSRALAAWVSGSVPLAVAFAAGQVAFVGFLLYAAAALRDRWWSPAPAEVELEVHEFGQGHRTLSRLGLTPAEASLVWKDLVGLTRRREMLPIVVMPLVLALVGFLNPGASAGGGFDRSTISLWGAWISGFFALMLSTTSLGQERRAIQTLFSFPISGVNLFRAKVVECLTLPAALGVTLDALVGAVYRLPALAIGTVLAVTAGSILVGTFLGLTVATRFSDFQERPRAQFVRPWAMVTGMLGGIGIIFAMVLPGLFWTYASDPLSGSALEAGLLALGVALTAIPVLYVFARRGAQRFFDELPT